ncbi:helicase-related protein [Paraburkholderia aspalathi]|uniref:helicase-related protein n=1 Tax=Paraburkholderia aspalathi TaxID=1324617 RepID=UPI0038BAD760
MADEKHYAPTYRDELALTRHFVAVLEQKLAGRDLLRRANVHPLDWCHLGVLGPAKLAQMPVQLDAVEVEAEASAEAAAVSGTGALSAEIGSGEMADVAPSKVGSAAESSITSDNEDASETKTVPSDPRAVADKGDEREGARRPPSAIGFEILVQPDTLGVIELIVDASFCIFTKHLPTLKEQTTVLDTGASSGAPLAEVVQRWPLEVKGVTFQIPANGSSVFTDGGIVQTVLDGALFGSFDRPDAERLWPGTRPKVDTPDCLKDEVSFAAFLTSLTSALPAEQWTMQASLEVRTTPRPDGKVRVGCYFRNETTETPPLTKGKGLKDAFKVISDVRVNAVVQRGELHPIEILPVPQDYQYDRRVWAVGHNTSVRSDPKARTVKTVALAVYEQPRIMTREVVSAKFVDLASDPFVTLEGIYVAMCDYGKDWKERVLDQNDLQLDAAALTECNHDYAGFEDEIRRFAAGIAALKADARLLTAFKASNRVFGKLASGYDSWRLFQVVFIVTQLPALAVREGVVEGEFPAGMKRNWKDVLDWGDVLWFRTGGGKTEAYLGLACCAMLYDRLRGKRFGMTAWLRFPLRMLSIQQLQRAMRVIWETEKERKAVLGVDADQSAPIRLGYFVGSTTTPNSIGTEYLENFTTEESLEWLRVVPDCPACRGRGTVKVKTDIPAIRFRHICSACNAELPLDISDDEVYRHLPTLVLGTIDKMASVGQQPKFGMLWGGAKWKCPQHGYAFGEYCSAFGCQVKDKKLRKTVKPYDPSPALHIQDELHLLQEELGAFAGHYETLIRYCEAAVGGLPSKVVAATATIEGFENQVRHLYGVRDARRFPGRGYDKLRSFYAEPDEDEAGNPKTARMFVAFKSTSMPPADASAFCTEILHAEIGNLFSSPHIALALLRDAKTPNDVAVLLKYYTTTLNYVGSLAKGSRVSQALNEISSKVRPGARDLNVEYHSSRSTSAEVADVVHRVESPPNWSDDSFLDALVATSMISHGVDLERVNLMTMDGVPEQTAEYIQASSRSGRRHVGMVVVVLAGFSLRASSIYHRFLEYHQHLDRMVSPVPVNRFAKYAAQRTLPGIALGLLFGLHAAQSGRGTLNKRNEVVDLLNTLGPEFLKEVKEAYSLGSDVYDERLEKALSDALEKRLDVVTMSIRNSNEKLVKDAVKPVPMTSLRDVEAGVPFWPDNGDSRLLTFAQRTKDR